MHPKPNSPDGGLFTWAMFRSGLPGLRWLRALTKEISNLNFTRSVRLKNFGDSGVPVKGTRPVYDSDAGSSKAADRRQG